MIEGIDIRRVQWLAHRYARISPNWMDADDLSQIGLMEGLKALRLFDPKRAVKFMTFVNRRIEGAMQDSIRKAVFGSRGKFGPASMISFEDTEVLQLATSDTSDPTEEMLNKLSIEIEKLTPFEKNILLAHYFKGVTQQALADKIGITAGRISQIMKKIRASLRRRLEHNK